MERIEAELRKKDKKRKSDKESDLKPSKKQRLSKFKFEPELVPVHLPEQLADSLRNLKVSRLNTYQSIRLILFFLAGGKYLY